MSKRKLYKSSESSYESEVSKSSKIPKLEEWENYQSRARENIRRFLGGDKEWLKFCSTKVILETFKAVDDEFMIPGFEDKCCTYLIKECLREEALLKICLIAIKLDNETLKTGISNFMLIERDNETRTIEDNRLYNINSKVYLKVCNLATKSKRKWLMDICEKVLHSCECGSYACNFEYLEYEEVTDVCTEATVMFLTKLSIRMHDRQVLGILVQYFYPKDEKSGKIIPRATNLTHPLEKFAYTEDLEEYDLISLDDERLNEVLETDLLKPDTKLRVMMAKMKDEREQFEREEKYEFKEPMEVREEKETMLKLKLRKLELTKQIIPEEGAIDFGSEIILKLLNMEKKENGSNLKTIEGLIRKFGMKPQMNWWK